MNEGLTIKQLFAICQEQIKKGNGDKHILISQDDEGNGFHTLFYGFSDNKEDIEYYSNEGLLHDKNDIDKIVLLG